MGFEEIYKIFEDYDKGRCISCGFLGKLDGATGVFHEATALDRFRGDLGCVEHHEGMPWCFRNKTAFRWDVRNLPTREDFEKVCDKLKEDIKQDRKCPAWYPWTWGSSPKEHFEEFKMQQLENERREFELKLEEINRQERKRTNRIMIWLTIAAIIFAAMQVYAALAAINPNSWLFNWLR